MPEVVRQVLIKIKETGERVTAVSSGNGYMTAKIPFIHRSKVKFIRLIEEGEVYVKPERVFNSAAARAKNSNLRVRDRSGSPRESFVRY